MRALAIWDDISPAELRRQARHMHDGRVSARVLAIANALEGMDRGTAARLAGMDRQILCDWVRRCNAEGTAGLANRLSPRCLRSQHLRRVGLKKIECSKDCGPSRPRPCTDNAEEPSSGCRVTDDKLPPAAAAPLPIAAVRLDASLAGTPSCMVMLIR